MASIQKGGDGFLSHARSMLHTHPGLPGIDEAGLLACIEACFDCAMSCTACADAGRECEQACQRVLPATMQ